MIINEKNCSAGQEDLPGHSRGGKNYKAFLSVFSDSNQSLPRNRQPVSRTTHGSLDEQQRKKKSERVSLIFKSLLQS